jgi:ABC-2 type transport system permease protein
MNAILAIVISDLRMLVRDRSACFFTLIFPVLFACFFGAVFSGGSDDGEAPKLAITIVDSDRTEASALFVSALNADAELRATMATSVDEARASVLARKSVAFIHVPAGYQSSQDKLFTSGTGATVELGIDPSRQAETGWIQGIVQKIAFQQLSTTFTDPARSKKMLETARASLNASKDVNPANRLLMGTMLSALETLTTTTSALNRAGGTQPGTDAAPANGGGGFSPVNVRTSAVKARLDVPDNSYAISFPQGMMWGLMGCAMGFAANLAGERTRGTFTRLCVSPLSPRRILLAKGLTAAIVSIAVVALMLAMAMIVFGVRPVAPLSLGAGGLATVAAFTGIMMFAATVGRSEQAVSRGGWAIMMMLAMIGGAAVPLFVMPAFMQRLSLISPVRWGMLALEGGIWRGSSLEALLPTIGVLCGIGLAGAAIGMALIGRSAGTRA